MFGLNRIPSIPPIVVAFLLLLPGVPAASPYKILVVMSYEVDFPWCGDISEGIESVVGDTGEIRYFYMDTKDLAGGEKKAKEAYDLFLAYQPDGVIASDDNAQSIFQRIRGLCTAIDPIHQDLGIHYLGQPYGPGPPEPDSTGVGQLFRQAFGFKTPKTLSELVGMTKALKVESDVLFVAAWPGYWMTRAPRSRKRSR